MSLKSISCFDCGSRLELSERIGFRELCPGCGRSLHVCLNCDFYDSSFNNQCREPQAERVIDKERANFCEYFVPRTMGKPRPAAAAPDARAKLDALFKRKL
jgi:hypothetical protein